MALEPQQPVGSCHKPKIPVCCLVCFHSPKDYYLSELYMLPVDEPSSVRLDSTFQPNPPEGWFGLGSDGEIDPPILALYYFQTAPWFHLSFDPTATDTENTVLESRNEANPVANPLNMIGSVGLASNNSRIDGSEHDVCFT